MLEKNTQSLTSKPGYFPLAALYGLFGLTSVAYEVLWARILSLQFGVSIFAVVLTVAAFMAGLGAGSLFAARRIGQIRRPLLLLAALEGGIAVYALFLPVILQAVSPGMENTASQFSLLQWYGLIAVVAFCLLLIPAFIMGAGFPLIISSLGNEPKRLGIIYGLNTLGAACGALLPLWLLPALGWAWAVRVVAMIGILGAISLFFLSSRYRTGPEIGKHIISSRPRFIFLFAYAGIGAASLILQIAWTRLFGMIMLRTEYVLSLILASFLLGIGLGSLLVPHRHRQGWFVILPIAAGGSALLSLWLLPVLSAWIERTEFASLFEALRMQGLFLVLVTLPVTLALGAWLPLLHRRSNGGGIWLYGANSLGAALGAVVAGLVLIPGWGSSATVVLAASILLILGLTWAQSRTAWIAIPVFLIAAWPLVNLPSVSTLLPEAQAGSRDLYVYEDAISMTHVVEQQDGQRVLLTDLQRMDASTDPTAVFVQSNQARLPLLLHENPHSVLFLGLGTGISVAGSLAFPDLDRSAVELSQGAIDSARTWFAPLNQNALHQTKVERDDVRHFLSATRDRYDVIIGDVFHPDLAGSSSLLSVQQFQRVHDRLNKDGVFVQWLALNQFDNKSLEVIFNSFRSVFPDAQLFLDGMHLALVGPELKFKGAQGLLDKFQRFSPVQQNDVTAGEGRWTWLGRYWGPMPGSRGQVQDEWSPVIEFHLPRARYAGDLNVTKLLQTLLKIRPNMEIAANSLGVGNHDRESFERAYVASGLLAQSWISGAGGAMQQATQLMHFAYRANPKDRWIAYALADNMFLSLAQARGHGLSEKEALQRILLVNPYHVEAVRALWRMERDAGDSHAEKSRARLLELSPLDREAKTR